MVLIVSSSAVHKADGALVVVVVPHGAPVVVVVEVVAQYTSHMGHHPRRDGQGQVPGAGTRAT